MQQLPQAKDSQIQCTWSSLPHSNLRADTLHVLCAATAGLNSSVVFTDAAAAAGPGQPGGSGGGWCSATSLPHTIPCSADSNIRFATAAGAAAALNPSACNLPMQQLMQAKDSQIQQLSRQRDQLTAELAAAAEAAQQLEALKVGTASVFAA
jgi:hypothetical protein